MQSRKKHVLFIGLGVGNLARPLYRYLREHPDLYIPKKPLNFFSEVETYARGLAWYEKNFAFKKPNQKCGELNFSYLQNLQGPKLIAGAYPEAKLFVVIDNPITAFKLNYLEALESEEIDFGCSPADFIEMYPEVLNRCRFGKYLTQYLSYYSSIDLLVVFASEVNQNPLAVTKSLFRFLGVNDGFVPLVLSHLETEEEEDPKKIGLFKKIKNFLTKNTKLKYRNWRREKQTTEPLDFILEQTKKVELGEELEIFLKGYFKRDVEVLSALLHRDLNDEWKI